MKIYTSILPLLLPIYMISCKPSSTRDQYVDTTQMSSSSLRVEVIAEGLTIPWSIVFTSSDRMLVTERNGRLRQIVGGKLDPTPVKRFEDVTHKGEGGLMGLARDPNYASNKYLYVSYMYSKGGDEVVKVVRYTDNGSSLMNEKIIFDNIPGANNHNGCRLRFGPDGKLYITTGDAQERSEAQKTTNVSGKILRINSDGTIPSNNPFGNAVWTYGHRNP